MSSAATAKAKVKAQAPKLIGSKEIKLEEISIAEDSGWREIDEDRCQELEAIILEGGWGATSLKGPSLIADDGGKVQNSTVDGKAILFEGKHLVKVLQVLEQTKFKVCPKEDLDWLVEPLEEIFHSKDIFE